MSQDDTIPPTPASREYEASDARDLIPDVDDPLNLFQTWLAEARKTELNDSNAMALATVDASGRPDVRMVLLKGVGTSGFVFFTHETSAKGQQLTGCPQAALCFHWKSQRRQVRVRGPVGPVAEAEADAYFASRARISQLGAWASRQSEPLSERSELESRLAEARERFGDDGPVERPAVWKGYALEPSEIEFWQDQPYRLHDRLLFRRTGTVWTRGRLYP